MGCAGAPFFLLGFPIFVAWYGVALVGTFMCAFVEQYVCVYLCVLCYYNSW